MKVSSNGISLNVRDTGVGETAIVFLHFWGGSSRTWDAVIELLAARYRCVAIDARGAGDSDAPTEHYRTADHATDALNVIRALRLNRFVLVGHSMGGKAAQLLAAWHPRGLMALVLVATSPLAAMAINDEQREQMRRAYEDRTAVEWTLDNVLSGSPIPLEPRARLIEDALRLSPEGRAGWLDIGSREDLTNRAAPVHIPVVIVAGESDRVDPVAVVKTHVIPRYPQALVRLLPNKGHMLPLEAPRDIAALIDGVAHPFSTDRT